MGIYAAGVEYTKAYAGGTEYPGLLAGGLARLVSAPAPMLTLLHTYTITMGTRGSFTGWWHNNIGTISSPVFTRPDGDRGNVRQTMYNNSDATLRFLLQDLDGLGVGDTDQFPVRIDVSRGALAASFSPQNPVAIRSFGQGIGQDYGIDSGQATIAQLFTATSDATTVELYYP